jgi:hypothetical protein
MQSFRRGSPLRPRRSAACASGWDWLGERAREAMVGAKLTERAATMPVTMPVLPRSRVVAVSWHCACSIRANPKEREPT